MKVCSRRNSYWKRFLNADKNGTNPSFVNFGWCVSELPRFPAVLLCLPLLLFFFKLILKAVESLLFGKDFAVDARVVGRFFPLAPQTFPVFFILFFCVKCQRECLKTGKVLNKRKDVQLQTGRCGMGSKVRQ